RCVKLWIVLVNVDSCIFFFLFFFFSSRRRHTRFSRDWSSDVCSSDLQGSPGDRAVVTEVELRPHEIEREDLVEVSGRWRRVAYVVEEADGDRRLYHIYFYDGRGLQSRCCTVESGMAIPVRRRRST